MVAQQDLDLTVVIVNWNAGAFLPAALSSLFAAQGSLSMEVLLVDNASSDDSVAWVREHYPQVQIIANASNRGFAAANNQGIRRARGRVVLLLNPDTEVPPDALQRMVAFLDEHPRVGVVGPQLCGARGKIQGGAAGHDPTPRTIFNYAFFLYRLFPHRFRGLWLAQSLYERGDPITVDWVSGASMFVRAAAIARAGFMDERYFMYSEDVEWCRRIRQQGYEVVCYPAVAIVHHIGGSARQLGSDFHAHNIDSLDIDLRRRYGAGTVALMHLFGAVGFLLRYVLYTWEWWRWRNPAFRELRDMWAACIKTSLSRMVRPAPHHQPTPQTAEAAGT